MYSYCNEMLNVDHFWDTVWLKYLLAVYVDSHILLVTCQIVMEFCGAGSVSDLMKIRNKTVSKCF